MSWVIWIIVAIVLGILEIVTTSLFFFLCLALGAALAGAASAFGAGIWIQVAIFSAVSIISLLLIKPLFKKHFSNTGSRSSNVDALIGKEAVVIEKVMPNEQGLVKVMGEVWGSFSESGDIEKDSIVEVVEIKGTRLIVRKK